MIEEPFDRRKYFIDQMQIINNDYTSELKKIQSEANANHDLSLPDIRAAITAIEEKACKRKLELNEQLNNQPNVGRK